MPNLVSVIIPTYNRNDILDRAINSVLNQSYREFELLIVDDGSDQNVQKHFQNQYQDPRIQWIEHHQRNGAAAARNTGIKAAKGHYIAFLDSDDEWLPNKLELQVAALDHTSADTMACLSSYVLARIDRNLREPRILPKSKNWYKALLYGCQVSPGSTLIVKKEVFEKIGLLNESLERLEDWEWLLRLTARFQIVSIPQILSTIHLGSWPGMEIVQNAIVNFQNHILNASDYISNSEKKTIFAFLELEKAVSLWRNNFRVLGTLHFIKKGLFSPNVSIRFMYKIGLRRLARLYYRYFTQQNCIVIFEEPHLSQSSIQQFAPCEEIETITLTELKQAFKKDPIKLFQKYKYGILMVPSISLLRRPFLIALALRFLCRDKIQIQDLKQDSYFLGINQILKSTWGYVNDHLHKWRVLHGVENTCRKLLIDSQINKKYTLDFNHRPVYLRTDLVFGLRAGGSVSHIAGILNHLEMYGGKPIFLSSDRIPTISEDIETHIIPSKNLYWNAGEIAHFAFNEAILNFAMPKLNNEKISFIYQRYSLGNISGLLLSRKLKVPYICEFNGSEVWIANHWGSALKYETLAKLVEYVNLFCADLVTVVSQSTKNELMRLGLPSERILVSPNAVNTAHYYPEISGAAIRKLFHLQNKVVVGFIGTFGVWHGAPVLAEAFGKLYSTGKVPHMHLLMVGEGNTVNETKQMVQKYQAETAVTFTGLIPQDKAAEYLAACDIVVLPHLPNPDGSEFFGSPIKMFEYMAMGKCILASNLDQIGEVLSHQVNAYLVTPGDGEALAEGLLVLGQDPVLRAQLGQRARTAAVEQHQWKDRVKEILSYLITLNGDDIVSGNENVRKDRLKRMEISI